MTKKTREWLFRIFVFLFIIITTTLSLHATGYRFNLSWPLRFDRLLIKTGILALDTKPKGAIIEIESETKISSILPFLNSNKERTTPYKLKNLLPGEYTVSFTMENYWPYQKKVTIYPEQTTFLEDVILFKKSLPLNVVMTAPQEIVYSNQGTYAYLKQDKKIVNLTSEQVVFENKTDAINWSKDGTQVYDGGKIFNLENSSFSDYQNLIGEVDEIQISGNYLIYLKNDKLGILDINTKTSFLLNSLGKILTYEISGDVLFVVESNQDKTEIKSFDFKGSLLNSTTLLATNNFSFNNENSEHLVLLDTEHQITYIISKDNPKIVDDIIRGVTVFKWIDGDRLLYATKSEIYIYNRLQLKPTLITRLGEKIESLAWSNDNYLIYATANNIGIINITGEGNDITVIWSGSDLSSLYFNNKDHILYFSGTIGQQGGLYKMTLK